MRVVWILRGVVGELIGLLSWGGWVGETEGVLSNLYPGTDAVKNQLPLPIDYRRGCIQVPAGVR